MFTGIITELGQVQSVQPISGGVRLLIGSKELIKEMQIGDSINVDGACQTVVNIDDDKFTVEAVGETLEKTTLGKLYPGNLVNLELPLSAHGRLGGHFVQGHVNATAPITQWYPRGENYYLEIAIPAELMPYVIPEGSIALNGISLTVANITENRIGVSIIPHTANVTNLKFKTVGDLVNVEVDMIAKYVENILTFKRS